MINNNMDMIKQMSSLFDYEEYLALCEKHEVEARDLQQFYQGMGALKGAILEYPDMDWQEAYTKRFQDIVKSQESHLHQESSEPTVSKTKCCGKRDEKPSVVKKGFNLIKATTEHIITGMKHVPRSVFIQRLERCKDCPSLQDGFVCKECGCYMGIKASWADQKCKLNKW